MIGDRTADRAAAHNHRPRMAFHRIRPRRRIAGRSRPRAARAGGAAVSQAMLWPREMLNSAAAPM
jgi:hypothetical protein